MMKRLNITLCILSLLMPTLCFAEANLVTLNDTLIFQKSELDNTAHHKTIKWSQSFSEREEVYLQLTTLKQGKTIEFVMLFVQKEVIPTLKKQCTQEEECKVKVTQVYQYGQNSEKTLRFLVLHNKANKPYQHRFMSTSTLATFASGAEKLTKQAEALGVVIPGAGLASMLGNKFTKGLKSVIGDPLREF